MTGTVAVSGKIPTPEGQGTTGTIRVCPAASLTTTTVNGRPVIVTTLTAAVDDNGHVTDIITGQALRIPPGTYRIHITPHQPHAQTTTAVNIPEGAARVTVQQLATGTVTAPAARALRVTPAADGRTALLEGDAVAVAADGATVTVPAALAGDGTALVYEEQE